ncbi:MAG: hypothetical protein KKB31_04280, partial [Nanoarchaeota archaeon]|nr:hypothetical protein [Nanoarchaeota archaeon]
MKKRVKKTFIFTLFLLGIVSLILIFFFQTKQQIFEFGFEPYGESVNQITDLALLSKVVAGNELSSTLKFTSKYWDITQIDEAKCLTSSCYGTRTQDYQLFSGSDLNFISATSSGSGSTSTILTSTEYFDERDFKTTFVSRPGGSSGTVWVSIAETSLTIFLVGDSGEVNVISHPFETVKYPSDLNILIKPSVITDKVFVYENGIKTKEINYAGKYKIKIVLTPLCGKSGQTSFDCGSTVTMKNPSYKSSFGCTTKPSEQTYIIFFKEGSIVSMDKLDRFTKFCLEESPLKIYSNTGGTTNTEILEGLVANEKYTVPLGQIWSVEYIGEKGIFATECEANQLYNLNEGECLARTVVNLQCAEGSTFDFDKGYCIMETEPILYTLSTIETHKSLEQGGQFRFTHIKSDKIEVTPNSIQIGESTFNSNGVSYNGFESGIAYPKDKSNWKVSFTFNGLYEGNLGDKFNLNEFYNVEITRIEGYRSKTMNVDDYTAEY